MFDATDNRPSTTALTLMRHYDAKGYGAAGSPNLMGGSSNPRMGSAYDTYDWLEATAISWASRGQ